jgi:hypothetical protein
VRAGVGADDVAYARSRGSVPNRIGLPRAGSLLKRQLAARHTFTFDVNLNLVIAAQRANTHIGPGMPTTTTPPEAIQNRSEFPGPVVPAPAPPEPPSSERGSDLSAKLRRYLLPSGVCQTLRRKTPITATDSLNDRVLPFFEEH